ncbi:MAG: PaaI family thioesterase [Tsuneonella suprasediminis]|uniref:PaaI family thioesterase n=1 Tax=Tsuneonella suprasediminis TaxID=2306996 RepID=A0A419R391_9SPHN|nr:PaaI family thioesterase [Tsuneonella suprasediminis]RJX68557.1 PaaI family thioesterase [Tsuneonella suprasediminis]UBS31667.1 PaaI family thioesterase [Altererythrobacter sp. N1]
MESLLTAYARSLGIRVAGESDGAPLLQIDFSSDVEGRPGAFHGGATAGLLETAGYAALRQRLRELGRDAALKPINITVEYLSAGLPQTSNARARIVRLGRRNANLVVEAWQSDTEKLIAMATMNVLIVDEE